MTDSRSPLLYCQDEEKTKYHLLLFDFDNTLVDTSECLVPAVRAGFRAIRVKPPDDYTLKSFIGVPFEQQISRFAKRAGAKELHTAYKA